VRKFLFFIAVVFCLASKAQNYIPLPLDTNHYWSEIFSGWGSGPTVSSVYKYKIKDTLVQSTNYKKVYMECFSPATPCSSPFFLLRQDSAQRKVFILINNQENILYNFNKVVGDTLKALDLSTGPSAIYTYTVIAIDSVLLLDNKYHKRFRYSTYNWNYAIEGVGGEWGLLTPYFTVFETGRETICLGTNRTSTIIYMNPAYTATGCTPYIMGNKVIKNKDKIFIYPNPVSDKLHIENFQDYNFALRDILGKEIILKSINKNCYDLSQIPKGIYFLNVYDKNEIILVEKIIKE
jgi:hypothetical protein